MNKKECFYATIERKPVDRPASWLGLPVKEAYPALYKHFGVNSYIELKEKIGMIFIRLKYHSITEIVLNSIDWDQIRYPIPALVACMATSKLQ